MLKKFMMHKGGCRDDESFCLTTLTRVVKGAV